MKQMNNGNEALKATAVVGEATTISHPRDSPPRHMDPM